MSREKRAALIFFAAVFFGSGPKIFAALGTVKRPISVFSSTVKWETVGDAVKLVLCTLAAIVLVGVFTIHQADAACWWNGWGWHCSHPYWHAYWGRPWGWHPWWGWHHHWGYWHRW